MNLNRLDTIARGHGGVLCTAASAGPEDGPRSQCVGPVREDTCGFKFSNAGDAQGFILGLRERGIHCTDATRGYVMVWYSPKETTP